ncbi:hypothetical protein [Spiroplasma poulsonii]|nr:hypothetical protein [Spiroplasma poulsonii]
MRIIIENIFAIVYCNCKHAFPKALINKMITSFKINATIFLKKIKIFL